MRTVRWRIIATLMVLVAAGVGGWQLLPQNEERGKTVAVGTTDAVTSLDPAGAYDAGSWALYSNVFQSLLTFDAGGTSPVPDAAQSCRFVGSGLRVYRCEMRSGVRFPSGRAMTARDVKYSFDRVRKINSPVGPASLLDTLDSVEARGRVVTFHLSSPDATFPLKVATGAGAIVDRNVYPEDALRSGNDVDGTGPYTLKSYEPGSRATLVPNSRYQGPAKVPDHATVLRYFKDSAALESAWKRRTIDVAARQLPPALLAGLSTSDPDQRLTEVDSAETRNLVLNVRAGKPLHDRRVRQALASLVDRDELVESAYKGTVDSLFSVIPRGITGHTTAFFDAYPKRDPARARALLQRAGVTTPVRFEFAYSRGAASKAEAQEIRRQLEGSGLFKVVTKYYDWAEFQKRYTAGKLDAYAVGWLPDFPDPDTFTAQLVRTGSGMHNGYSSKPVDELIQASQQYEDRSRTLKDFRRLQQLVADDVPIIPLWQRKEYVLSTNDITGGQYLSDGTGVFRLWSLDWI
ncbi:ABC transporter substrate-binding protein [Streptomyces longispororuber]|uniref:ABC transporter substrate-binding protein n=1 Tax=Streptomyces longispororuber TaxID=68230 RepID=UPI00210BE89A|nr:ABC transporter substrate-binding protein [Streptomyces longispororuber]MCQ4214671.1 ABC transporter substrate-binding protein [Streptomyces longispororuber]